MSKLNRKEFKELLTEWRNNFINEANEDMPVFNEQRPSIEEYVAHGLLEKHEDGVIEIKPIIPFKRKASESNIFSIAKMLIEDIMSRKIVLDSAYAPSNEKFKEYRNFVKLKTFYSEALEEYIHENLKYFSDAINSIALDFNDTNPRSMLDFGNNYILPKFSELITKIYDGFKEKYNYEIENYLKEKPIDEFDFVTRRCLEFISRILSNFEIHPDLYKTIRMINNQGNIRI